MAEVIRMPKMSDTMEEGVIASWLKKVGDEVKSGDILAEVETDKATMELESYENGVLLYTSVEERGSVPVDGVIAIIGEKGEKIDDLIREVEQESPSGPEDASAGDGEELAQESTAEASSGEDVDVAGIPATVVTMPKMSDTMTEGVIASWQKKVGDQVESGDILAEVETDKATMELEAYESGYLLYIGVEAGQAAPIDGIIAIIGEKDADYKKLIEAHERSASKETEQAPPKTKTAPTETEPREVADSGPIAGTATGASESNGRIKISPLAKKLAADLGYDLRKIRGTGENGRIIKRDVEAYEPPAVEPTKEAAGAVAGDTFEIPAVVGEEQYEDVVVSQMRKTIARRLAESKFTAPHFYLTMEINMDRVVEARKSLNDIAPVKISYNDIILKAAAAALRQHPDVNVSWMGDKIRRNKHIHIGVAVAVDEGLLVPVVRYADNKSLSHIAAEVKQLGEKARTKKLQPEDWQGNTFTISNLGMFGIEEFTAIINPPDACIMAVGGIKEIPVVVNGEIRPGHVMKVTLSCDHRAVDGATGAAFLQTFKNILEDPVRILI